MWQHPRDTLWIAVAVVGCAAILFLYSWWLRRHLASVERRILDHVQRLCKPK